MASSDIRRIAAIAVVALVRLLAFNIKITLFVAFSFLPHKFFRNPIFWDPYRSFVCTLTTNRNEAP